MASSTEACTLLGRFFLTDRRARRHSLIHPPLMRLTGWFRRCVALGPTRLVRPSVSHCLLTQKRKKVKKITISQCISNRCDNFQFRSLNIKSPPIVKPQETRAKLATPASCAQLYNILKLQRIHIYLHVLTLRFFIKRRCFDVGCKD